VTKYTTGNHVVVVVVVFSFSVYPYDSKAKQRKINFSFVPFFLSVCMLVKNKRKIFSKLSLNLFNEKKDDEVDEVEEEEEKEKEADKGSRHKKQRAE